MDQAVVQLRAVSLLLLCLVLRTGPLSERSA